jgi:REP element-mobilizing transposase RayT
MVTRACTQRKYLLRPDRKTVAIFAYCLAEAAERFNIGLIAWLVMSNHYHAVVYDPEGNLPRFIEHLHKMLAKVLNVRWGRWENLWATEETCITELPAVEDIFRKVLYVLANPVSDHLVEEAAQWPGLSSLDHLRGKRTTHRRPELFFSPGGVMPESVNLEMMLPPQVLDVMTPEVWAEQLFAALKAKERAAHDHRKREGRRVVNRRAILCVSPNDSPSSKEPRRTLRPAIARKNREDRIRELRRLVEFRHAHAMARRRYVHQHDHDVVFPEGTYRMRLWGARCADTIPIAA